MVITVQPAIPFFQGNEYEIWSTKMRTLFISEDLWELVDEGYAEEEMPRDAVKDVRMRDAKGFFLIQQAIAESIFPLISKATKSKEAWDALQTEYQSTVEVVDQDGDGIHTDIIGMDDSVYEAAAKGNIKFLKDISKSEFQVQLSPKHNTVLHIACEFGETECVRWILNLPSSSCSSSSSSCSSSSSFLQRPNLKGDTPLHLAAREGHLEVVKALLNAAKKHPQDIETGVGANKILIRMTNKEKNTALHEAVRFEHSDVVELLIEEDPEFTYCANESGITPLYMAAERRFTELVKTIIHKSATSPLYTGLMGRTALHAAVICNDQEMTKTILRWKPKLTKEVDENGWSPLHYAAEKGCDRKIVKLLLETSEKRVAYLESKDGNKTALHIASFHHHSEIVEEILSHSPGCLELVDDKGNNFFHFAMMKKVVNGYGSHGFLMNKWLRRRGLVNEKDGQGNTPLHLLSSYQNIVEGFSGWNEVDKKEYNKENLTAYDIILRAKEDISGEKDRIKTILELIMPETRFSSAAIYNRERTRERSREPERTRERSREREHTSEFKNEAKPI